MEKINLGLQIHAVREAFDEDPVKTFEKIAAMGYEGVELNLGTLKQEPQFYTDALDHLGLKCFSAMCGWAHMAEKNLDSTISLAKGLGITDLIIHKFHQIHLPRCGQMFPNEYMGTTNVPRIYVISSRVSSFQSSQSGRHCPSGQSADAF